MTPPPEPLPPSPRVPALDPVTAGVSRCPSGGSVARRAARTIREETTAVLPGAEGFSHTGVTVGVLLCHGFTGTPQSMRDWARHLAEAGYGVELPLLPGHGTTWQDLNRTTWRDWYATVDTALTVLRATCPRVIVGGLSMGGALALRLAIERRDDVSGLVLVNPCLRVEDRRLALLPVMRRLTASFPGIGGDIARPGARELAYDRLPLNALSSLLGLLSDVVHRLASVDQPLLLLRSAVDHVVPASSGRLLLASVSSPDTTEVVLDSSYHVATLDNDADRIVEESLAFIARVSSGAPCPRVARDE
jgi:carboxylesterase